MNKRRGVCVSLLLLLFGPLACRHSPTPSLSGKVDRIIVVKSTHTMTLVSHGSVLKTYRVSIGRGRGAAKNRAGDRETPEGVYVIDAKISNSRFHRALHISYPNTQDQERAQGPFDSWGAHRNSRLGRQMGLDRVAPSNGRLDRGVHCGDEPGDR